MKDRIPTKPGRIQLVPSPDDDDLFILTRADEPTQTGTPLNKASLLKDSTAVALDLSQADPTVDDALASVAARYAMIRTGANAPTADTVAKKGDIYVQDNGGARRLCYICDADGECPSDLKLYWERGALTYQGVNDDSIAYRVRCDLTLFPAGTKMTVASGYRFGLYIFSAARAYQSTVDLRTAAYTFAADTWARVVVARVTENTSETADIAGFSAKLGLTSTGRHWTPVGVVREVEKEIVITESGYFNVPADAQGDITVRAFGGGAGGSATSGGYGGGGGNMAVRVGTLGKKRYAVTIGAGGGVGGSGGTTTFGTLVTATGGSGANGGSGGGAGSTGTTSGGNGSYGGGGGGYTGVGGNGGTYGGGGGGGFVLASGSWSGYSGGSGKDGTFSGGNGAYSASLYGHGGGGGGYAANGSAATSSANGDGGVGMNVNGFSLDFEGPGAAGTSAGGGGGYGGKGGNGSTAASGAGGGGGGYGSGHGGNGGSAGGGGGGGWGGKGGNGSSSGGGGGGGYGLGGNGGAPGQAGGLAAGGGCGAPGGPGVVIITYKGLEVVR